MKKDLLFHEKRMQLLLSTRVVDDLGDNLKEKMESRMMCAEDCRKALEKFQSSVTECSLTGRWSTLKISSMFGLEVPLQQVVGSGSFDEPTTSIQDLHALLNEVNELSKRIPEFQQSGAEGTVGQETAEELIGRFVAGASKLHWTPRDIRSIKDSIQSKRTILMDLKGLSTALQEAQFNVSKEQMRLEELRRTDEGAFVNGEMATAETTVRERMSCLERLIDMLLFQSHSIESSVDSNVNKRKSNVATFVNGAAVIQCVIGEKERHIKDCDADLAKVARCLRYEESKRGRGDAQVKINSSSQHLNELDAKHKALAKRLKELYDDFTEVEMALDNVSKERAVAIENHVELLENSRHTNSDFLEMQRFAELHRENLQETQRESTGAIELLKVLEKVLLQQKDFETYDFQTTARRLNTMQRRVCVELNRVVNDHCRQGGEIVRRMEAQMKALTEQIDFNLCEAELRRDTLDPTTKKYVTAARELEEERDRINEDCRVILSKMDHERDMCMSKIRQHLTEGELVDCAEEANGVLVSRQEELLDLRQELITPPEMGILDERLRVAREKQAALAAVLQDTTRRSRVLQIRNDINRVKVGAPTPQITSGDDAASEHSLNDSAISAIHPDNISAHFDTSLAQTASLNGTRSEAFLPAEAAISGGTSALDGAPKARDDIRRRLETGYQQNEDRIMGLRGGVRTIGA